MFKRTSFMLGLLATVSAYAEVHIVGRLEIVANGETKTINYDKVLAENGSETFTSESGISLTGTITGIKDDIVYMTFEIKDAEGNIISQPSFECSGDKEASVKIGTNRNDEVIEQIALFVTAVRN